MSAAPDADALQQATDAVVTALKGKEASVRSPRISRHPSPTSPCRSTATRPPRWGCRGRRRRARVEHDAAADGGTVEIGTTSLAVYLQAASIPTTIDELRALPIASAAGLIRLDEVTVEQSQGPTSITTQRGQRTATVTVSPSTDDLNAASATVTTALDGVDLPTGADAKIGGVLTQQQDAFAQLGLAMLAAILIVYIVMVATFKSLRQPLLLLVSVPFAATGAILLQIATGVPVTSPRSSACSC